MNYKIKKTGKTKVLTFDGALTLPNAQKIKESLMKLLENDDPVTMNLDHVTEVDLSGLQLICSAHRTFEKTNTHLTLNHPFPEVLHRYIKNAGYFRHMGCEWNKEERCLWLYQEE